MLASGGEGGEGGEGGGGGELAYRLRVHPRPPLVGVTTTPQSSRASSPLSSHLRGSIGGGGGGLPLASAAAVAVAALTT